jgi:hypothetical protein
VPSSAALLGSLLAPSSLLLSLPAWARDVTEAAKDAAKTATDTASSAVDAARSTAADAASTAADAGRAAADAARTAVETSPATSSDSPLGVNAAGWAFILSPVIFYALFNVYRSQVNPRANFGDAIFAFAGGASCIRAHAVNLLRSFLSELLLPVLLVPW